MVYASASPPTARATRDASVMSVRYNLRCVVGVTSGLAGEGARGREGDKERPDSRLYRLLASFFRCSEVPLRPPALSPSRPAFRFSTATADPARSRSDAPRPGSAV